MKTISDKIDQLSEAAASYMEAEKNIERCKNCESHERNAFVQSFEKAAQYQMENAKAAIKKTYAELGELLEKMS